MHEYPKVLRYDHPEVPESFWNGNLLLTEKTDGTNIRLIMYDERYHEHYNDNVLSHNPSDEDILIGTRRTVRGTDEHPVDSIETEIDGALHRVYRKVKRLNKRKIKDYHAKFDSPIVWFAEGMVRHSIDYDYSSSPPPALLGFDVYVSTRDSRSEIPPNPFEQTFEGFLETEEAFEMLENVGIQPVNSPNDLDYVDGTSFDPDEYNVPQSKYANLKSEGVVLRNDGLNSGSHSRVKIVSNEFEELNKDAFGYNEQDAETPEERFLAVFCTEARIRKIARKMVIDEGVEFNKSIINDLWRRVYDDIWTEEYHEIKELNFAFNPSDVKPLVANQVANTVDRMITNAELNDTEPTNIWRDP